MARQPRKQYWHPYTADVNAEDFRPHDGVGLHALSTRTQHSDWNSSYTNARALLSAEDAATRTIPYRRIMVRLGHRRGEAAPPLCPSRRMQVEFAHCWEGCRSGHIRKQHGITRRTQPESNTQFFFQGRSGLPTGIWRNAFSRGPSIYRSASTPSHHAMLLIPDLGAVSQFTDGQRLMKNWHPFR